MAKKTVADELRERLRQVHDELALEHEKVGRLTAALEQYRESNRTLHERLEKAQELGNAGTERLLRVVDQLVDLKREGFSAPYTNPVNMEKLDVDLDDVITDAIDRRAQPGTALHRQLVAYALQESRLEAQPGEIAKRILDGGSPPEEEEEGE